MRKYILKKIFLIHLLLLYLNYKRVLDTMSRLKTCVQEMHKNDKKTFRNISAKHLSIVEALEKGNVNALLENSDSNLIGIPLINQILFGQHIRIHGILDPFRKYFYGFFF